MEWKFLLILKAKIIKAKHRGLVKEFLIYLSHNLSESQALPKQFWHV